MEWDELNRRFLPVPWTSFPSENGPLLLKLLYEAKQNQLAIMATDLQHVYFESLNSRQTHRRLEDALAANADTQSQTQSQDVMVGIGDEGEKLLHRSVEELLSSVTNGMAGAEISHEAFEHLIAITTPSGLVVRFLTTSLETASATALAAHLVSPLLGVCSGLLSLLREHSDDDSALCRRIEGAIDASGNAERMKEGRSAETFAKVGGPALIGRWIQRSTGARDKDIVPVSLSLPSRPPRPFSPMPTGSPLTQGSHTPPRRRSPPPRLDDGILTPPSAQPLRTTRNYDRSPAISSPSGLARKMLHHDSSVRGERIGWDDSQSQPVAGTSLQPALATGTGSTTSPRASDDEVGEHEPSTEDEDVPMLSPRPAARTSQPPGSSPLTAVKPDLFLQPPTSPKEQAKVQEEKAQRKKASEKEAEEARRRERLKRLPPVGGSAAAAAKKKRRL